MATIEFLSGENRRTLFSEMSAVYLHGKCYEFAIALHEGLALPLVGVQVGDEIIHVGVQSAPDIYRDVRGDGTLEEFLRGFDICSGFIVRSVTVVELMSFYLQKTKNQLSRRLINNARVHAEALWTAWDWKDSEAQRMKSFACELEELCQRHGIWIREQFYSIPSILYFGDSVEDGYELKQSEALRVQFSLHRKFKSVDPEEG